MKLGKKLFSLQSMIIVALFALNAYIFERKIKKVRTEIQTVDGANPGYNVCLEHASVLAMHQFHDYAKERINVLKHGVDAHSCEVLDYVLKCMEVGRFLKNARFAPKIFSFPEFHSLHLEKWKKEELSLKQNYRFPPPCVGSEVFYFHHGLRFANKKIQNYVRERDIIDAGEYAGESLLVLRQYTNKTVYCFEFFDECLKQFAVTVKKNKITSGYKLIPSALGESVRNIRDYEDSVKSGAMLITYQKAVNMTTIDEEARKHNMVVGFIKTDVEGYSMPIVKGAIKTIQSQRPVLSLGIYHNYEELFKIKPFLEQHLTDYIYEFHLQSFMPGDFNEMILLCYPKELAE